MFADYQKVSIPPRRNADGFSPGDLPEFGCRPDEAPGAHIFPIILGQRYIKQKAQ